MNLDELGIRKKLEHEIKRYNAFQSKILGQKKNNNSIDVDVRNYAQYLLKEGTILEKRELLGCLRSKLVLKGKKVFLS